MLPDGARILQPVRCCDHCGVPGSSSVPLHEVPPGVAEAGLWLCPECVKPLAQRILQGPSRAIRRARAAQTRRKGDEKRKRRRR